MENKHVTYPISNKKIQKHTYENDNFIMVLDIDQEGTVRKIHYIPEKEPD